MILVFFCNILWEIAVPNQPTQKILYEKKMRKKEFTQILQQIKNDEKICLNLHHFVPSISKLGKCTY